MTGTQSETRPLPLSTRPNKRCCCLSFNSLPSVWYGIAITTFHAYIVLQGSKLFIEYMDSKFSTAISTWETNLYISLQATALLLLPFLAFASIFKLGNLANDGYRLGRQIDLEMDLDIPRSRARDPLVRTGSACGAAWRHCPPVGPSLHAVAALCSLVAKVVLEARMIKDQLINRDQIWSSDLDLAFLGNSLWPEKGSFISSNRLVEQTPYPSPEFFSYVFALLAFAVRCSDVFWGANKCLAFLVSLQLIANGIHALLAFCGASVLYKVALTGVPAAISAAGGSMSDYLLLDPPITVMLLMLLSCTLVLGCSPLNMYALNKLALFLTKSRKKYIRELPSARSYLWSFYPHLAALATLLAVAASAAPLLHDFSKLYKLNPQPVLLVAVTASIVHAFLWVALWLLLTAKSNWDFRLKISVGRTLLNSPSSLALAAEIEFKPNSKKTSEESEALLHGAPSQAPTLILSGGKAYGILDPDTQRKIQQLVAPPMENPQKISDNRNQVYWLRGGCNASPSSDIDSPTTPTLPEPLSGGSCASIADGSSHKIHSPRRSEVAINTSSELPSPAVNRPSSDYSMVVPSNANAVMSPSLARPVRKPFMRIPSTEEDGDYATLRDLPLVTLPEETEPVDLHEMSSSSDSSGVDSGFSCSSKRQNILPIQGHGSRLATPNRDLCNPYGYVKPKMTTFTSLPISSNGSVQLRTTAQSSPFNSLPLTHMQRSHPIQSHETSAEERRPAIQACLFAGHGLEANQRP
ncbi:hypothetical protein GHT06_018564 [Daphnia sinensis]|uniref:Protein tincar n=1 Tax=Daphnia sinensis TaxID=1820382 RepID=A0AAD5PT87_9CRUS|nr:hypothetical protein GHT06_018564 [Daphnia sinensis]